MQNNCEQKPSDNPVAKHRLQYYYNSRR